MKLTSFNDKLILEPYQGANKVEAKVSSGFATIKQKSTLIGLKCLASATVPISHDKSLEVSPGDTVYFSEEILHSSDWAKKAHDCDALKKPFIIAPASQVVLVKNSNS